MLRVAFIKGLFSAVRRNVSIFMGEKDLEMTLSRFAHVDRDIIGGVAERLRRPGTRTVKKEMQPRTLLGRISEAMAQTASPGDGIIMHNRKEEAGGMVTYHFPQKAEKFEIKAYEKAGGAAELKKTHVAFCGMLFNHPKDPEVVVLSAEPYGKPTFYYEFRIADISCMEEVSNLVNLEGEVVTISKIWVKKGVVGVRCLPFLVDEIP
jgi:inorganic pyrophosphatase